MDLYKKYYFLIILLLIHLQNCCEPLLLGGLGIAGATAALSAGIYWGQCQFKECCNAKWTIPESKSKHILLDIFKKKLFGQHLVLKVIPNAVYNHVFDKNPRKALVMSFHGWTGSGKNYVCNLLAEYLYREGTNSVYIHTRIASEHFPNLNNVENYRNDLRNFIKSKTKACGRSIFIFDEMDKMPEGVTDVLKPFIDYYHKIDDVDYRKNIFIFLNNIGGDQISEVTLQNFRNGDAREDINTTAMEDILSLTSLKFHGGFKDSTLILSGLVDFFVPFLPMERLHVKQCASVEIKRRDLTLNREMKKEIVEKVTNEIQFYPKDENIFSKSGCKLVSKKVDMHI